MEQYYKNYACIACRALTFGWVLWFQKIELWTLETSLTKC